MDNQTAIENKRSLNAKKNLTAQDYITPFCNF